MKRRFVLITDPLTPDQEGRLAAAMPPPIAWWHYLPNTWLIVDYGNQMNTDVLRGLLTALAPTAKMFATEVPDGMLWTARHELSVPTQAEWFRIYWDAAALPGTLLPPA